MEFRDLPHDVQVIACRCLADKISSTFLFGEESVSNTDVKKQAHMVRDAFIALLSDRELEGDKAAAAAKLAATIMAMQQLVADDDIANNQLNHVISASNEFIDKCL